MSTSIIEKRGGKRAGAGAPLLGEKKRVEIKTTIDSATKNSLEKNRDKTGESIGQCIDRAVLFLWRGENVED